MKDYGLLRRILAGGPLGCDFRVPTELGGFRGRRANGAISQRRAKSRLFNTRIVRSDAKKAPLGCSSNNGVDHDPKERA